MCRRFERKARALQVVWGYFPIGANMERKDKVEGEGSYSASKDYNERTKKFVDSGKVDEAARKELRLQLGAR